jgi:LPXTG-site transpeptidase (sortase) family protein
VKTGVISRGTALRLVRGLGWTFVWVGVFLLGFVAHQLFVTDFLAQRAQTGLAAELDERAALEAEVVEFDTETGAVGDAVGTVEGAGPIGDSESGVAGPEVDAAALDIDPSQFAADQFILREPVPASGDAVGTIRVPTVGLHWTVVEGVSRNNLKSGAGHMPDTPLPAQPGNAVVSGHRTTFGAPFHNFGELEPGDLVYWDSPVLGTHTYVVRHSLVVRPTALWVTRGISYDPATGVVEPADATEGSWLTLTTCHPKFSARQRLIVFAELVDGPNAAAIGARS